jgi:type I restriction enzyme S subunit
MDAQQFLAEFGHIANAPGGVQRVRELILQLAISGDLTQRVELDIPASVLFEHNQNALTRHFVDKKIKRPHPTSAFGVKDLPWTLPEGWVWCRLGQVTNYGQAPKADYADVTDDTWVLELEDIEKTSSKLLQRVRAKDRKFQSTKNGFPSGAVLYGKLRPYLDKVLIADERGVCTTEIIPISFFHGIDAAYLRWYLKSPYFVSYASNSTHGMNLPRMGTDAAREAFFPFPPKQEQARIVAKVDELMALCDKLESQLEVESRLRELTRRTVFGALADASSAFEVRRAWSRLESSLSGLLVAPEDVSDLRQIILGLAVAGRLTLQTDRVDVTIVEQMQSRKRKLAAEKIIKRETPTTDFPGIEEMLQAIPDQWVWCRLNDIASVVRGGSPRPAGDPKFYGGDIPFLKVADVTRSKGMFVEGHTSTITEAGLNKTREITERTVLLTNSGATLGVPGICTFRTTFNDGIAAFIELHEAVFDEYLYFYLKSKTRWLQDIASRGQGQPNLNTDIIRSMWFPLPPLSEQYHIVARIKELLRICDVLVAQLSNTNAVAKLFAIASSAAITGIRTEEEEELKTPKNELISKLRLVNNPDIKEQAPLAAILARHQDEMPASDLWQRYGGDIDAFYAQLKLEVGKGWIEEPSVAEMREVEAG